LNELGTMDFIGLSPIERAASCCVLTMEPARGTC